MAARKVAGVSLRLGMLLTAPQRQSALSWTCYIGRMCRGAKTDQDRDQRGKALGTR